MERLDRGSDRGLLLLSSTAGSGKTSLLAHWLHEQPLPVAWLTLDEAAELVTRVSGRALAEPELRALVERTEGWAAGLQAAALALKGRADPEAFVASFTGSHRYGLDFLDEEVVDRQPEALRSFLLRCSILEELSGALCDAVTGAEPGSGATMLDRCERENLFVVALDPERSRFALHRLFADRLRHRLQRERPAELPELHRRASRHFEARGRMREAIEHGLAAGDLDRVAVWIGALAESMIVRREVGRLGAWLEALPEADLRRRPGLCIAYAQVLQLTDSLDRMEVWLQAAEDALAASAPDARPLRGQIAAVRARAASWQGDVPRTIALGQQALELLDDAAQRAEVGLSLGLAHHMQGEVGQASANFAEAARQLRGQDRIFEASVLGMQAEALKLAGRLREAESLARQALELGRGPDGELAPALGRVQIVLGNILLARGELEAARACADEALVLGERGQTMVIRFAALLLAAHLHEAAGDPDRARQALGSAEQVVRGHTLPTVADGLARFHAALEARFGEPGALIRWARAYERAQVADPDSQHTRYDREAQELLLARAQLVEGRPEAAEARLRTILPACLEAGRLENALHARLLLALSRQAAGRLDASLETLGEALAFAEREGHVQAFVEQGAPMAALLRGAIARGAAPALASELLGRMKEEPARPGPSAPAGAMPLLEPLTEREIEVLRLLAAGFSNREIADALVIAVGTVKRHVTNINSKLDAGSRSRAVARARAARRCPRDRSRHRPARSASGSSGCPG